MDAETRTPDRPKGATANKARGTAEQTPAIAMGPAHVPSRGESFKASKGTHRDGLAQYAQRGVQTREPLQGQDRWSDTPAMPASMDTRKPENVGTRMAPKAGTNTNKGI